jgi:holo-[acyl-carrier protein] synthase
VIVGSGIDVVEIARIQRALHRRGERFERRVFTDREIDACRPGRSGAARFAVRFAAKEALMKAIGTGWAHGVRWVDIEIVPGSGRLGLHLHGRTAEIAEGLGGTSLHLAVSRNRTHALAVVLLEGRAP